MSARHAVAMGFCIGGFMLATFLMWEGWVTDHSRLMIAAAAVASASWVGIISLWALGRFRAMIAAYQSGYRAGRRDANHRLIEDGFWLSAKAEEDARKMLDDEGDGLPNI